MIRSMTATGTSMSPVRPLTANPAIQRESNGEDADRVTGPKEDPRDYLLPVHDAGLMLELDHPDMCEDLCLRVPFPGCSSSALLSPEKTCYGEGDHHSWVYPVAFREEQKYYLSW